MSEAIEEQEICLFPDCGEVSQTKGLCNRHYGMAYYAVKSKKTTWEKLLKEGKIKEKYNTRVTDKDDSKWFTTT